MSASERAIGLVDALGYAVQNLGDGGLDNATDAWKKRRDLLEYIESLESRASAPAPKGAAT